MNSLTTHSPTRRFDHGLPPVDADRTAGTVEMRPAVVARLEALDDTIFAAINGDADALDRACEAWDRAVRELGYKTVEETRQQYLRRARSVWDKSRRQAGFPPHKSFAALEIISLLNNAR